MSAVWGRVMRTGVNASYGPRALSLGEWLVLGFLTWRLVAWLAVPEHRGQADFVHYFYVAGWRLAHGLSPYDFVSHWGDSFYNPPWFALLLVPFSFLSVETASLCWLVLSLGLLAVSVTLAQRLCNLRLGFRRIVIVSIALTWWRPVSEHLALGQSSLIVSVCTFVAILALHRGHPRLAGLTLVMAASKPQLLFLLGPGMTIWEWRRQRSFGVLAGFTIGVAAVLLICLAITPAWVNDLLKPRPESIGAHVNTRTLLVTAFGRTLAIEVLYIGMFLLGSAATLLYWAKSEAQLVYLACLTIPATLVLTPYAHLHDYVVLVLPLMLIAAKLSAVPGSWWVTAHIALVSWLVVSIDFWLHRWIDREGVRIWLQSRFGEQPVAWLWEQSQWNWRFIAMLLPLGIVVCLLSSPRRTLQKCSVEDGAT
jgi:hypothetical protein